MKSTLRNLFVSTFVMTGMVFALSGEFSSDVTFGDDVSFSTPYTGVSLSGDGWELSTNLSDGNVSVEEAKYTWNVTDKVTATFGLQATPYGLAWGLHRPSNNSFVSVPREHATGEGVGLGTSLYGVNVQAFYGNDEFWAGRVSYSLFDHAVGVSADSDESLLVDVSGNASVLGVPVSTSLEYDASSNGDGAYWVRSVVTPDFAKGASLLVGYNSDDELLYGVRYNCSDNVFLSTELSGDGDTSVRVSYKF